jgi:heavy metal translocating P-type ATPase
MVLSILSVISIAVHFLFIFTQPSLAKWPLLFIIFIGTGPLIWQIALKIYQKNFGADILAVLSILAAFVLGQYLACVLVITMLASGQALEDLALKRASSLLYQLTQRMPTRAHRRIGDIIEDIDISEINVGDLIIIYPHETSPVDGEVAEGHGHMDESYLTGEPYKVSKSPGVFVISGSINSETALVIRATKLAKDSRYAQIIKIIKDADEKKPRMRRLGDQLGAIFTPIALFLAASAWIYTKDPMRFLSVLVIATPCPLLIALPVVLISAISLSARRGILIKDPLVLERLPTCVTAIFDKTGTLTLGQPRLTEIMLAAGSSKNEILIATASLEQYSKHPLSKAILDAAKKLNLKLRTATRVEEKPGRGLVGVVDNIVVKITSRQKLLTERPELEHLLPASISGLECIVLINNNYAATLRFHDDPRADSLDFVSHLRPFHSFKKIMLVSGDRESEVLYLAKKLQITHTYSSQSPEQKLELVREETRKNSTLFVGDGINDAPALRAATVGIAFGNMSAVTREAGGAVIMENTLSKIDELLHISIDMRAIALQSAIGGMGLSFIGMGFAAAGLITPVAGALLQQAIDIIAILNALRLSFRYKVKTDLQFSRANKNK